MKIKGFLVILVLVVILAFFIYYIGSGEKKIIKEQVDSFSGAKEKLTRTNMNTLKRAVDSYSATQGKLPNKLEDINLAVPMTTGKYDAWGKKIKYQKISELEFRLISAGRDGIFNTDDDIIIK
jgi:Na+-transporting methylmalonyl-CoA/oxaloacetate decarboxylase gamma subunit